MNMEEWKNRVQLRTVYNMFGSSTSLLSITMPVIGVVFWFCGSYAPGLGQSGVGRTNPDMDYVELMGHGELPSIDENLNLDHFSFSEFIQSYNTKPQ